jgi:hypothetical protein
MKLLFAAQRYEEMLGKYKELLSYTTGAVSPNVSEKGINRILDYVSTCDNGVLLHLVYETTLEALTQYKNDRLWFKTHLKLAYLTLESKDYARLVRMVKELLKYVHLAHL